MSGAIAIFVKTPGLSPVKTRLAAGIGRTAAETWYLAAADAIAEVVRAAAIGSMPTVYWAIAEADLSLSTHWTGFEKLTQGVGELGERMARVHTRLVELHGYAVLLGADTPQIDATELHSALYWLAEPDPHAVIGPACDGGFWMFGSNRCIALEDWNSVAYSRSDTQICFQEALSTYGFVWQHKARRTDVDTAADLERCVIELDALKSALPGQSALANTTRQLLNAADAGVTAP